MSDLAGWLPACLTAACSECVCACVCVCISGGSCDDAHGDGGNAGGGDGVAGGGRGGAVDSLKLFVSSAPRLATPVLANPSFTGGSRRCGYSEVQLSSANTSCARVFVRARHCKVTSLALSLEDKILVNHEDTV